MKQRRVKRGKKVFEFWTYLISPSFCVIEPPHQSSSPSKNSGKTSKMGSRCNVGLRSWRLRPRDWINLRLEMDVSSLFRRFVTRSSNETERQTGEKGIILCRVGRLLSPSPPPIRQSRHRRRNRRANKKPRRLGRKSLRRKPRINFAFCNTPSSSFSPSPNRLG